MQIKLCYILTSAGLQSDSVQKKVISQINALNNCGVLCRGFFFTNDVQLETKLDENITLIPYPKSNKKYFNIIKQRKLLIKKVSTYIEQFIEPDELIYLRYPGATYTLYRFAKKFPNRIISEHQSMEIEEIRSARYEHPIGLNLNKLLSFFLYQLWPVYNEKIWARPYSRLLLSKVSVTREIAAYHIRNCKKSWVIPNGIETNNYLLRNIPDLDNEVKILFLKGTSGLSSWNGLDRLIMSIDNYQSQGIKILLIICGSIIEGEVPERSYIVHKGYLKGEELDTLFSTVHIGFSTLCLFRKNLHEASVLKAREYFARGLPFVYAYIDPDIDKNDSINQFIFQVPNDDSMIDINEVINFAIRVSKDVFHPQRMRKFANNNLDWKIKMSQLKDLLISEI